MIRLLRLLDVRLFPLLLLAVAGCARPVQPASAASVVRENSLGMRFVRIEPGSFRMGGTERVPARYLDDIPYARHGDWDERPARQVTISRPFYIAEHEVTVEQFRAFRASYAGSPDHEPYATGVSWYEAVEFAAWLSAREGVLYRLPTEAEWEYICRAGTRSPFWSGDEPPQSGAANRWGVRNLHTGVAEWVLDWHGAYPAHAEVDPVGPAAGHARVVRGGGLDRRTPYYARCANRASIAPSFPPLPIETLRRRAEADLAFEVSVPARVRGFESRDAYERFVREQLGRQGDHPIGFRLVIADPPATPPRHVEPADFHHRVVQELDAARLGPDPSRPHFRSRPLLPTPPQPVGDVAPQHLPGEQIVDASLAGLHPAMLPHLHSPALEVAPNGDVIAVYYTAVSEVTPDVALVASRLRHGEESWDLPDLLVDFADVNDHAPMLWRDADTLRLFWGANRLESGFPFQWITSIDNGATWSEPRFPEFETPVGPHSAQPINTAFRGADGTIYLASDGHGITSQLWVSENGGRTWQDRGGRTLGRHTAFAPLADGRILGIGGKNSNIDGYLPAFVSSDGARTWSMHRSPFPTLDANQRPILLRLESGRLLYAGDFQRIDGFRPPGITGWGAFVALSGDDGQTWQIRSLPDLALHKYAERRNGAGTIGYTVARQAPNGVIHLITSMNHRNLHLEFNEAWILEEGGAAGSSMEVSREAEVHERRELYDNGRLRAQWSVIRAEDGRPLKHGREAWYHPDGALAYEATFEHGLKLGREARHGADGRPIWVKEHGRDGTTRWVQYWPGSGTRSETHWRGLLADGVARHWDPSGRLVREAVFEAGELGHEPDE